MSVLGYRPLGTEFEKIYLAYGLCYKCKCHNTWHLAAHNAYNNTKTSLISHHAYKGPAKYTPVYQQTQDITKTK
jgi:hypothetical protein